MKINTLKVAVIGALMVPLTAIHAEEVAPAEDSGFSFSANVGLFSDYIWRGQSQTQRQPALQGGFDVEHSSGFYAGVWASNVEWTTAGSTSAMNENSVEVDVYAGFGFDVGPVYADIGVLQYLYPGHDNPSAATKAETDATEVYAGLGHDFGFVDISGYAYYLVSTDGWNFAEADGTVYYSLDGSIPVGDTPLTVDLHVGYFDFDGTGNSAYDYTDWKVNVDYAFNDNYSMGAFYTDTDQGEAQSKYNNENCFDETFGVYLSASF